MEETVVGLGDAVETAIESRIRGFFFDRGQLTIIARHEYRVIMLARSIFRRSAHPAHSRSLVAADDSFRELAHKVRSSSLPRHVCFCLTPNGPAHGQVEQRTAVLAPTADHSSTVVFLHGLGDTAMGWTDAAGASRLCNVRWCEVERFRTQRKSQLATPRTPRVLAAATSRHALCLAYCDGPARDDELWNALPGLVR